MSGLNLHAVVRGAINSLHPDISVMLYQSSGQTVGTGGQVQSIYAPGVIVQAQAQSEGPTTLFHADKVGQEEVNRKFYLFSSPEIEARIAGIVRPLTRGGDMFQVLDTETWLAGTWWLVDGVIEDFTRSGWCSVRAVMQVNAPNFMASEWYTA